MHWLLNRLWFKDNEKSKLQSFPFSKQLNFARHMADPHKLLPLNVTLSSKPFALDNETKPSRKSSIHVCYSVLYRRSPVPVHERFLPVLEGW